MLERSGQGWQSKREIQIFRAAHEPLTAAVCTWAGLKLDAKTIRRRARELEAMVEGTGSVGPRNWRGQLMRRRTERWARRIVRRVRAGKHVAPVGSPLQLISDFRDSKGAYMDVKAAAVELLNVIRPTVANARYLVFGAMALLANPAWRKRLAASDEGLDEFVDEVRRFYPFIPFIGGRVREEFTWCDHAFKKHDWVLMDLYGTNHDPRIWGDPGVFRPERFVERTPGPFDLVSHGAGDRNVTHRCPGEWITVEQMKVVTRIMVREMSYTVPEQDLRIDLGRIPAIPKSRFLIRDVRIAA